MKQLFATSSAAAVALMFCAALTPSFAQDQPAQEDPYSAPPAQQEPTGAAPSQSGSEEMVGKTVFDSNGQKVGAIEEIAAAEDGSEEAIISVGGFLGMGAKKVYIATSDLAPMSDGSGYSVPMTAEELESALEEGAAESQPLEPEPEPE